MNLNPFRSQHESHLHAYREEQRRERNKLALAILVAGLCLIAAALVGAYIQSRFPRQDVPARNGHGL